MDNLNSKHYVYVCKLKDEYAKRYGFANWKEYYHEYTFKDSFRLVHALDTISIEILNAFDNDKVMSELLKLNKSDVSGCRSFRIGDIVYHRSVYEHKEPLKVVGITEDKLLLEGDYSGGTHNVVQRDWLPIKGTSRVHNHAFKLKARKDAIAIETLAIPCAGSQDNTYKAMMDMVNAVMVLTSDVSLNPEF